MDHNISVENFVAEHSQYASSAPVNALTVDVEDYFQVSAFEKHIGRDEWEQRACRVESNTQRILSLFDRHGAKGTFFTLGWVAERYPQLIRDIANAGHEIASHGFQHTRVTEQNQEQFRDDISRTKKILEDVSGQAVTGYRAATFSIGRNNLWALDVLQQEGYKYSSSIYPVNHDLYGMPEAPRFAFRNGSDGILEVPVSTLKLFGRTFPCGGGGYFRLLPYPVSRWALKRTNSQDKQPAIFYFHPWEVDPQQPRVDGISAKTKFRHYLNLERMEKRLSKLLKDFRWGRMDTIFAIQ